MFYHRENYYIQKKPHHNIIHIHLIHIIYNSLYMLIKISLNSEVYATHNYSQTQAPRHCSLKREFNGQEMGIHSQWLNCTTQKL